jgi:hypothetical protein
MLTASMQKNMDYQKETHTNRRSRLISTLLVSISYIIILLTSCTTEHKSDQEIYLEVCDTQRPYFYYQLTCKNDTITFFSPSRGYTKQAINPIDAKRLHNLAKSLCAKEPFIYEGNYDALNDYEEDLQFEYRTHYLKMYINGKLSVFVAGFDPSLLPKEYRPIFDILYSNTAFIGKFSNITLADEIFDEPYFILN